MAERWILQFCHSHYGPFADVTRQYAALFKGSPYKVLTVYLTGEPCESARQISASDEVIFLDFSSRSVGGLKLAAIRALKKIAASRDFFDVAARFIGHRRGHCRNISRAMITRMISLVPSRIWWTRRSRTTRSSG